MFFRKSKLIRLLTQEIQRLREILARTEGERDEARQSVMGYRDLAQEAIGLAKEKHFPKGDSGWYVADIRIWPPPELNVESTRGTPADLSDKLYLPDYSPPKVKHCPECSVSVRSESWPQACPACHCVFGFPES